ncbi:unnamed protein product [Sphagnum balticum]
MPTFYFASLEETTSQQISAESWQTTSSTLLMRWVGTRFLKKVAQGITQAGLVVINKTDLAEAIGADLKVMEHDALHMHDSGLIEFAQAVGPQVKHGIGVQSIVDHVVKAFEKRTKFK